MCEEIDIPRMISARVAALITKRVRAQKERRRRWPGEYRPCRREVCANQSRKVNTKSIPVPKNPAADA